MTCKDFQFRHFRHSQKFANSHCADSTGQCTCNAGYKGTKCVPSCDCDTTGENDWYPREKIDEKQLKFALFVQKSSFLEILRDSDS